MEPWSAHTAQGDQNYDTHGDVRELGHRKLNHSIACAQAPAPPTIPCIRTEIMIRSALHDDTAAACASASCAIVRDKGLANEMDHKTAANDSFTGGILIPCRCLNA